MFINNELIFSIDKLQISTYFVTMSVKSISKTLNTLDYFLESDSRKGIGLKEICDHLGFKKSAAHHMLATICDKGLFGVQ